MLFASKAHGHDGGLIILDRQAPSHRHFGSFSPNPAAGCVLIALGCPFAEQFVICVTTVISPGWCLALRCYGTTSNIQIINLHLEPALALTSKMDLLEFIAGAARAFHGATFFSRRLLFSSE